MALPLSLRLHPSSLPIRPLTARQMHAMNLLAMGKTVVSVAKTLDVGVSTLHRWKATHPLFRAELAQRQHNLFDAMITKLRLTMSRAVDQLFEMMTGPSKMDRKEVMREMLKLLRPQKYLVPSEPMTAEAVLDERVREMRASRGEVVGTEITEEERLAAIPDEWRVEEVTPHRAEDGHAERSEASDDDRGSRGSGEQPTQTDRAPATRGQILRSAQDDVPKYEVSTPLPSREGPGEGAAIVKTFGEDDRAGERDRNAAERLSDTQPDIPVSIARSIASRPLPRPAAEASPTALPQGEGSQNPRRHDPAP